MNRKKKRNRNLADALGMPIQSSVSKAQTSGDYINTANVGLGQNLDLRTFKQETPGPVLQRANPQFQSNIDAVVSVSGAKPVAQLVNVNPSDKIEKPSWHRQIVDEVVPLAVVATFTAGPFASLGVVALKAMATGTFAGTALSAGEFAVAGLLGVFSAYCATAISVVAFQLVRE